MIRLDTPSDKIKSFKDLTKELGALFSISGHSVILARFLSLLTLSMSKVQLWLSSLFKLLRLRRALFNKDISTSWFTFTCCCCCCCWRDRLVVGRNELYSRLNSLFFRGCSGDCSFSCCCCCWGWSMWFLRPVGISKQWQLRWLRIG